jgi:hypothetical protein
MPVICLNCFAERDESELNRLGICVYCLEEKEEPEKEGLDLGYKTDDDFKEI